MHIKAAGHVTPAAPKRAAAGWCRPTDLYITILVVASQSLAIKSGKISG
jgi:hypothetical protein